MRGPRRPIDALLEDYSSQHRARGNRICHAFGITLIVYGTIALLLEVPLPWPPLTAAEVLIAAVLVRDALWSVPLSAGMLVEAAALDLLARAIHRPAIGLAAFAAGWVFQAVGHARFERNRPAFFRNLIHLLVGPLFLWNELVHARPVPTAGAPRDAR